MNTLYLKYALEVERMGSITQAAQNLYMAQPNLSKALKDLETELGITIFKRTPSGVKVTKEGSEFLYHARCVMEQIGEMEQIAKRKGAQQTAYKLSIPRGSYIAEAFAAFVAELEAPDGMEITVNETNAMGTITNVTDRGYNMGIIRYPVRDENYFRSCIRANHLCSETIWEFEYLLVFSKDHPLAEKAQIRQQDLEDYIRIAHGDSELMRENADASDLYGRTKPGRVIYVYERGSQFDLLTNVPNTYMWVSPIPKDTLERNHLVQRVCEVPDNQYKDVLIYRQDYPLGERDKLFQKKLYESKIEVASRHYR